MFNRKSYFILGILIVILFSPFSCFAQTDGIKNIVLSTNLVMGYINPGDTFSKIVTIKNQGTDTLEISNIRCIEMRKEDIECEAYQTPLPKYRYRTANSGKSYISILVNGKLIDQNKPKNVFISLISQQTHDIEIKFTSQSTTPGGMYSARLEMEHNDKDHYGGKPKCLPEICILVEAPKINVVHSNPYPVCPGNVATGTITLNNHGILDLEINSVKIIDITPAASGVTENDFTIGSPKTTHNDNGITLPTNIDSNTPLIIAKPYINVNFHCYHWPKLRDVNIDITFTPTSAAQGITYTVKIEILHNDNTTSPKGKKDIVLLFTVKDAPDVSIKPWVTSDQPPVSGVPYYTTEDIWLSANKNQTTPPKLSDQHKIVANTTYYIFAQFRNEGSCTAEDINVEFYVSNKEVAGLNFLINPQDFDSIGSFKTGEVVFVNSNQQKFLLKGQDAIVYIEWIPQSPPAHRCIAVEIIPSSIESNMGNNIAQENLAIVDAKHKNTSCEIEVFNPNPEESSSIKLILESQLPEGWEAIIEPSTLSLEPGELHGKSRVLITIPSKDFEHKTRGLISISAYLAGEEEPYCGFSILIETREKMEFGILILGVILIIVSFVIVFVLIKNKRCFSRNRDLQK
jgi:hypothetical protein